MGLETERDTGRRRWHLEANPRGALVNVGREKEKGGREGKKRMKERGKERGTERGRQQEHGHKTRPTILVAIWVVYPAGKK